MPRRVYQTTLIARVWNVWGDAPGLSQRFTGRLAEDGQIVIAQWETAPDSSVWQKDFDLAYRRVG